ncbi:MAG: SAM-dependent methyltransferase [Clostridia bacterium]|nr:SAM-dependent methyltransferase [Clostridia bacterium]
MARAAALFPACAYGADIGADHGRLSCYLLEKGVCQRMCVADISESSLKKAENLLERHGLMERADIAVGDGLKALPRPAEAIAVLGMGGRTLSGILTDGRDRLRGARLILSAHTEIAMVRETVMRLDYRIEEEQIAFAAGRSYVVFRAAPGIEALTERQLLLGPRLTETYQENYLHYLAKRIKHALPMQTEQGKRELQWLKEEEERVRNSTDD